MKIFCLFAKENWFVDRFVEEFYKYSDHEVVSDYNDADLIWIIAPWMWNSIPMHAINKPIICTIHHEVPEKMTQQRIQEFHFRDQFVTRYHVPCNKTKEIISKFTNKPIDVIGYWYDQDLWVPYDKTEARKELGLPENDFMIGSFQRDTEGSDLISPKLEKGPDLFCDYVEKIAKEKDNVHVILNGWRRQYVINRLQRAGIKYTYRELPPISDVRKMYASCDLYVVAARYEGGPQSVLEAPAMNVPIVSTNVGMASETLDENCIIDIENEMYYPTPNDIKRNFENVQKFKIQNHVKEYDMFFESIIN